MEGINTVLTFPTVPQGFNRDYRARANSFNPLLRTLLRTGIS